MRRLSFFIGFIGLLACSDANVHAQAQAQQLDKTANTEQNEASWTVNKAKSTLTFSGVLSGEAFTGSFSDFGATINFDPDNLTTATVVVIIDMNSAETDDVESTNALPGKEWFNVRKFPTAKFEATDFKYLGGDSYEAKGGLSIRGTTGSINLPFTLKIENGYANMDAALNLNRTTYKVGTGMWASKDWVEHVIAVRVHLEAQQNK
ncbi:MAG: polyisoprenoid-binding protein [Robiginitomaculum sp.]|nr:MAG: polyisoprenoid-binding protein [Robiginitomaculum sp.]